MKIILALMALALTACTNNETATRVLQENGDTEIEMTGYRYFGCSKDDQFHTGFNAKSPNGHVVSGIVCGGFLKGSTIRFN